MKIKLGNIFWDIEVVSGLSDFGETDYDNAVIRVREEQPLDMMTDSFIHEILHAAFWSRGVSFNNTDEEERIVRMLTPLILQVLTDNPQLLKLLDLSIF